MVSDLYSVVKDFIADDENAISLRQGELVEVLDIGSSSAKRLKLDIGGEAGELLDTSAAKHKLSIRPKRKHADPRQRDVSPSSEQVRWLVRTVEGVSKQGWIPANILRQESPTFEEQHRPEDAKYKREAVVRELVETEEEFGRDLQNVVDSYMKPLDSSSVPRIVRDNIDVIFSNLRQIANFHNTVLIEGVKYYANEPRMIGKTFLRLERDFDKHVAYCRDEPAAQEFLTDNPSAKDFFEELSQRIGDDKSLSEHLKLPIQRINDYQLLLKELVKYSARLGEPTDDLKRALELMLAVPHRANDNKFISNIEGFHGNIHKLGRLLRHDWFTVADKDNKSKERYLFLFKARILICKVKRISEDRSVFVLKDIIRLPEVEVRDCQDDWTFELHHKETNFANYPIRVTAHKEDVKSAWLKEIRKYASDALALQEHAADDLRISEDSHIKENTDPAQLLKAQLEARLHKVAKKIETEQVKTTEEIIRSQEQAFAQQAQVSEVTQQSSIPLTVQSSSEKVSQVSQVTQQSTVVSQEVQSKSQVVQGERKVEVSIQSAKTETQPQKVSVVEDKKQTVESVKVTQKAVEASQSEKVATEVVSQTSAPVQQAKPSETPKPQPKEPEKVPQPAKPVEVPKVQPEKVSEVPKAQPKEPEKVPEPIKQPEAPKDPQKQPDKAPEPAKTVETPKAQPKEPEKIPEPTKPVETLKAQPKEVEKAPEPVKPAQVPEVQPKEPEKVPEPVKQPETPKAPPKEPEKTPEPAKPVETPKAPPKKPEKAPEAPKPAEPPKAQPKEPEKAPEPAKPSEPPKAQTKEPEKAPEPTKPVEPPKAQPKEPEKAPEPAKPPEPPKVQPKEPEKVVAPKEEPKAAPQAKAEVPSQPKSAEKVPEPQVKPAETKVPAVAAVPQPAVKVPEQVPAAAPKAEEKAIPQAKAPEPTPQPKAPEVQTTPPKAPEPVKPVEAAPKHAEPTPAPQKLAEVKQEPQLQQNPGVVQQKQPPAQAPSEGGIKRPATDEPSGEKKQKSEDMSHISSTTSTKITEESYSISSQHEEVVVQSSSSSQYSATSVSSSAVSATAVSSSSYQSSSVSGAITEGGVTSTASTALAITETGRPVFKRTISGLSLEPGDTAVFECQLESSAAVTWLKDNKALEDKLADRVVKSATDDHTYRLELQHVHELDSGIYTALAQTKDQSATCTAQLVVQGITEEERKRRAEANAPLFTVRLKDTELLQNTNFRFMVKVKGNPNPEVKFFKDGQPVKADGGRVVLVNEKANIGFYELVIADVQPQDSGNYSCVATNSFGEAHCEGKVTVTDDKKVFAGLEHTHLLQPGEKPEFSWLRDGKPFDPEERFKVLLGNEEDSLALVFQHVRPEDAGLYTCVASTTTGKISCSAELSVQGTVNQLAREPEKPKLTTESKDSEAGIGGTAMLEAKILGFPKPQVKWYHDGQEVKASGRFKFLFEDDESMTLVIKNVVADDAGIYKIVAKNELGEDTTELKLTVKAPPKFKKKLQDLNIMVEEEMKVTVEVEGSPPPDIKWYKDGKELAQSDRVKFIKESNNTFSLVIQKAALSDSGSYSVVATNEISQSSEFFNAEVHTPPKFLRNMEKNIVVGEGGKIEFQVKIAADPPPKIRWLKDGVEVKADGSKVKILSDGDIHTLIVNDANRDDGAEYSIELSNVHGVSVDKGRANVKCAPVFKVPLKDTTANEGDTNVEFVVNVNAFPKPSIKWFLDETEITEKRTEYTKIEEGDNYKLIIKEVTTELKGKYTCKVTNDLGSTETSAKLTVNCKPRFGKTLQPKTEVDEGADLTLQIECYGCPEPEIKWFKDGQEIHADAHIKITRDSHRTESYSMTLNLVKGTDTGDYEVKATNTMGSATTKSHVHVYTFPQISNHDMEKRNIFESLSTSYFVDATGIPRPTATWYKDGVELKESDRVKISDEGETYRLELLNLVMDDAGIYKVKIANRLGEKTQEAKLELTSVNAYRKPTFKVPLVDQKIPKLSETVHTTVLIADPIPEIVWLHNGKEIDIDDVQITANVDIKEIENNLYECTYTLTIPQSLHAHTGIYALKAKNKYGDDESSCRLDVLLKPEIENLRDITGIPYEEAEFESIVYSNPPAVVKWMDKNNVAVKNNDHTVITEDRINEVFKLKFVNIGLGDGGDYTLVCTNDQGESTQTVNFYVHTEEPTIVKPLEDMKALDYSDVDYHIRFNGVPKAQVKWFKDGKELKTNDRITIETTDEGQVSSTLSIKHFCVDDVGQYSVTGSNLVGSAESKSNLKMIQLPPTFGKMLPRLEEVDENDTLDLKCKLDGSPVPKVKWFKDGEPLEADGHVQLFAMPDGSVRLLIENVKPTDCGAYKLVAENPNGQTAAICAVAVKPKPCKPTLLKGLENQKEIAGEPLRLECKVMAFPAPEIKWFKDGHPIRPSQAINFVNQPGGIVGLIIDALRPEDEGVYSVKITNRLGETSGEAKVEVQAKEKRPMFEAHLMPVSVVEGFPAKLEVKATGHPKPLIKWLHKGKEIVPDGQHIRIIDQPDGTTCLLIDKATAQDAGEYAAVAGNEKGEVSSKAELQVAEKGIAGEPDERPSFLHALRDVSVEEGTPLILSAPFIGNPIPDVTWTKDERPISANERILLTCDGKKVGLEIKPAALSDAGTYSCRLVSPLGEATSQAKATVRKVFQVPTFTQKFSDLQQLPTYVAKFPARIIGVPKPEVEWFFNDKPIKEGEKYHIKRDGDMCCLYVRDCAPEDSGKYRCRAYNKDGDAECEAKLDVVDKIEKQQKIEAPSFLKKTGDCEVYKGMTARFTACATGYPEPEFEWYRGEDKIYPNDRVKMDREGNGLLRLTISGVDVGDVGKYRLRIFNPHGEASCESELIYESLDSKPKKPIGDQYLDYDKFRNSGAPLPLPDKPIISKMTDRHLTLSWKPSIPHGPRVPVTYRVEMAEQPDGDWFTARTEIRSCACDIRNLEPFRDYKFRIRVENKYGISDPSPFAITYRQRLEPEPPKFVPYLSPGIDFRPETSPYFPKDFDVEKPPHDGYAQAPRFLRQEHDTQYGVKNHNCNLFWFVYGYPKPKMSYTFNDEPIEMGGRYECSYTRNGQATLFINRMLDRDVGIYEAIAVNEHGEARQRVRLDIAEYPTFIERPEETIIMIRKSGRITARVTGVPEPEIKWYKDWQPIAPSSRIKIQQIPPDQVILIINDVILKDEGLYSVSARNVAGAVSSSAMIHIEENEQEYGYMTYSKGKNIKPKTKPLTDFYDLGDELGRGTQGVTYHAVERLTGRNYAAKVMHGRSEVKAFMLNELDILNVLNHRKLIRLQDTFELRDQLILVLELAGGGELLDALTRQTFTTETEIAGYIRQILWGLEHLHSQEIAHLGLTLNDLLLSHPGGDDLKICDFGLARRIAYGKLAALDYGMPEYVAPEIANGEGVSYPADLWAVGIITYILLSGVSPFKGLNDRDTLTRIREGKWEFREDRFCNISEEARDFISKLLVYTPEGRLDIRSALKHPWLDFADKIPADQFNITTDSLKSYYSSMRDWYNNASCRTWYRRRPLSGAFSHPSKMVYPPGHVYTPEPEASPVKEPKEPRTWEERVPSREPLDYETGMVKSESHYQYGPDTYLLQLRDVDLPCRLRHYMKVAANRQPGYSLEASDKHIDMRTPVIRERRRFTDIMDEEIDDERRARINQYGSADIYSLRRLRHELGLRSDGHAEAEAMLEYKREGQLPFFREKPQLLAIIDDQPAELSCLAVGEPKPTIQWFKNDLVVVENSRVKLTTDDEGRSFLKFEPALHVDVGIYKVVARNKVGQTIARARVVVASAPSSPDSPEATEVSDTEILLRWKQPKDDGHSPVLCYSLQYKEADNVEWLNVASNIDHEFWLMRDLKPLTSYVFRLSARNAIGWSEKGIPTALIKTRETGAQKIIVSRAMKHLQNHTESGGEITPEDSRPRLNYSIEKKPIEWTADSNLTEKYSFVSELSRGRFSVVAKGIERSTDQYVVAKLLEVSNETEDAVAREFENIRSLRHERVVSLLAAIRPAPNIAVLVMEKLQGADILTYFTSRHEYSEQMVATVITQVLDGLQYLHWRGLCHLDIQPDNIVLGSVRSLQIKIIDLGSAQRVSKLGTIVTAPSTDYTAPEILCNEPAFPQTDIWSLGVLTYVLLSGVSPYRGVSSEETRQNITFVRYRFEYLYKELTQEATRFLMLVFKRTPNKRPTVEECYEHRWLLPTEFMIKKRERAVFLGNRLKEYCDAYHGEKSEQAIKSEGLTKAFGERILARSNSIQEELTTTF